MSNLVSGPTLPGAKAGATSMTAKLGYVAKHDTAAFEIESTVSAADIPAGIVVSVDGEAEGAGVGIALPGAVVYVKLGSGGSTKGEFGMAGTGGLIAATAGGGANYYAVQFLETKNEGEEALAVVVAIPQFIA